MYFCYPDVVKKKGAEYYLNKMDSLYSGLSRECMEGLDRSRFSIFISNLMKYIDQIRPADVPLDMMISDRKERFRNRFMVDRSQLVIAVYDGRAGGGTARTLAYARKTGRKARVLFLK